MLYKNEEIFELNKHPEEIKKKREHFHNKFPVKLVYPPDRIIPSRHNRLPDKPNSISFDLKSVVKTKTGTEVWRYAEEVVIDNKGNKRYIPKKFRFNGLKYLGENEIELIYFLYTKSEFCMNGPNRGKIAKFAFEDPIGEAEKKAREKAQDLKIANLIYADDSSLTEAKLRAIARAFFIKNVDEYTLPEVKIILDKKIYRTKNGAQKFMDMIDNTVELNDRVQMQDAIDKNIVYYDDKIKKWFWNTPDGKVKLICQVPPSKSALDSLYDIFSADGRFREDIKASLISVTAKKARGRPRINENVDVDVG